MLRRNAPSIVRHYTRTGNINLALPAPTIIREATIPVNEGGKRRLVPL